MTCKYSDGVDNNRWPGMGLDYSGEILRAMYSVFAEDWLSVFPKEQILFLRTEDSYNMTRVMNEQVFPFLEIKPVSIKEAPDLYNPVHAHSRSYEPMLNKTKKLLNKFYAPFNRKLAKLLGDKKWLWNDVF